MKRIRIGTGVRLSFAAICAVCIVGIFGSVIIQAGAHLVQTNGFRHVVAVATTCILSGIAGNLSRQLPNYYGRPPLTSLLQHLKAPAGAAILALLLGVGIALLLRATPVMSALSHWALNAAIGLNLGVIAMSIWTAGRLVSQYRAMCKGEDRIPPHQRGF